MGCIRAVLECLEIAGRRREEKDGGGTTYVTSEMPLKGVLTCGRGSSWTRTSLFQFQESLSPPEPCREE